jgi:hypothetical protein
MSRDRTRTRERTTDEASGGAVDLDGERRTRESDTAPASEEGWAARVGARAGRVFSPRGFIAAVLVALAGLVAGTALVPLPASGLLGVFLAAFLFGLVQQRRHYLETTVASGTVLGAGALLGYAVVAATGGFGVPSAAVMGAVGGLVGAVGHYFGRDLRDGLTRDL